MSTDADNFHELALQAHQISSTADPRQSIRAVLAADKSEAKERAATPQPRRFVGRPYFLWKDDPALARALNGRLADRNVH